MNRRENRELWRWAIAAVAIVAVLVWIYAIEPVMKAWGWLPW